MSREIKFRKGDIIHNRYAGHPSIKYFIYLGVSGRYVNGLELREGEGIKKCQYYKSSMNEMLDGKPPFKLLDIQMLLM